MHGNFNKEHIVSHTSGRSQNGASRAILAIFFTHSAVVVPCSSLTLTPHHTREYQPHEAIPQLSYSFQRKETIM